MSYRSCKPVAREKSQRFANSGAGRPNLPPFCKRPIALYPLCCVCHKSIGCCSRSQNWYADRPRFGLLVFSAAKCSQLFLVLSIRCVCCRFLGTSQNVRAGVWLAHKCVPTTYMTWGNLFLFNFKNFIKQTKVLEMRKQNERNKTAPTSNLFILILPIWI